MEEDKKEIVEVQKAEQTENTDTQTKQTPSTEKTKKDRKGFCIASMVLGIVSLVFFCLWYLSLPCAILAVIFGILGVKSLNKGMAIAGIVTGAIGLLISIFIIIIFFVCGVAVGISDYLNDYSNSTYESFDSNDWDWYDYD